MTICPVAIAVGCKKCPIFKICPVKGTIGDYKPEVPVASAAKSAKKPAAKKAAASKPKAKATTKKK